MSNNHNANQRMLIAAALKPKKTDVPSPPPGNTMTNSPGRIILDQIRSPNQQQLGHVTSSNSQPQFGHGNSGNQHRQNNNRQSHVNNNGSRQQSGHVTTSNSQPQFGHGNSGNQRQSRQDTFNSSKQGTYNYPGAQYTKKQANSGKFNHGRVLSNPNPIYKSVENLQYESGSTDRAWKDGLRSSNPVSPISQSKNVTTPVRTTNVPKKTDPFGDFHNQSIGQQPHNLNVTFANPIGTELVPFASPIGAEVVNVSKKTDPFGDFHNQSIGQQHQDWNGPFANSITEVVPFVKQQEFNYSNSSFTNLNINGTSSCNPLEYYRQLYPKSDEFISAILSDDDDDDNDDYNNQFIVYPDNIGNCQNNTGSNQRSQLITTDDLPDGDDYNNQLIVYSDNIGNGQNNTGSKRSELITTDDLIDVTAPKVCTQSTIVKPAVVNADKIIENTEQQILKSITSHKSATTNNDTPEFEQRRRENAQKREESSRSKSVDGRLSDRNDKKDRDYGVDKKTIARLVTGLTDRLLNIFDFSSLENSEASKPVYLYSRSIRMVIDDIRVDKMECLVNDKIDTVADGVTAIVTYYINSDDEKCKDEISGLTRWLAQYLDVDRQIALLYVLMCSAAFICKYEKKAGKIKSPVNDKDKLTDAAKQAVVGATQTADFLTYMRTFLKYDLSPPDDEGSVNPNATQWTDMVTETAIYMYIRLGLSYRPNKIKITSDYLPVCKDYLRIHSIFCKWVSLLYSYAVFPDDASFQIKGRLMYSRNPTGVCVFCKKRASYLTYILGSTKFGSPRLFIQCGEHKAFDEIPYHVTLYITEAAKVIHIDELILGRSVNTDFLKSTYVHLDLFKSCFSANTNCRIAKILDNPFLYSLSRHIVDKTLQSFTPFNHVLNMFNLDSTDKLEAGNFYMLAHIVLAIIVNCFYGIHNIHTIRDDIKKMAVGIENLSSKGSQIPVSYMTAKNQASGIPTIYSDVIDKILHYNVNNGIMTPKFADLIDVVYNEFFDVLSGTIINNRGSYPTDNTNLIKLFNALLIQLRIHATYMSVFDVLQCRHNGI